MNNKIIACICEGNSEHAIMDLLLDNNKLNFHREDLLDDKIIKVRSAKNFEDIYLRKNFQSKITVYRILDSRKENFKLRKIYEDYCRSNKKPSDYCKQKLKFNKVKSYNFVKGYFSDVSTLIASIKKHKQKAKIPKNEITLYDLLKWVDRKLFT